MSHINCDKLLASLLILKRYFKRRFPMLYIDFAHNQTIFHNVEAHHCSFSPTHWISLQLNDSLGLPRDSFTALKLEHLDSLSHRIDLLASVD